MTDFIPRNMDRMQSFVAACQRTLDADAGLMAAAKTWNDKRVPIAEWPPELKRWMAAQILAAIVFDKEVS